MSWIEIAGVLFNLVSVVLTIWESVWCWPTGIVGSVLFFAMFLDSRLYADMVLQVLYVVLSIWGWYRWARPVEAKELPISRLGAREGAVLAVLFVLCTIGWGTLLVRYTDANLPYWNSATVAASLVAQWLLTKKVLENWHVWIAADVVMVGVYLATGLKLTAALYVLFTVLAISGLRTWQRSALRLTPG